jgi:protein O-GlcNAc transferase
MSDDERADEENAAGMSCVRAGRIAEAIPHFERASRLAPGDRILSNNLSAALTECGRHEEALALLDRLVASDPHYAEAHHNRSVALRTLGRLEEAAAAAEEAIRLRPDYSDAVTNLAITLAAMGRFGDAGDAARRALALDPRSALAAMTLGTIAARDGYAEQALQLFRQAIALKPDLGEAHVHAGIALRRLERLDEASECFGRAAELPGYGAEGFLRLGDVQAVKRERGAAIASYERALALQPDLAFARVQRLHLLAWQCAWDSIAAEAPLVPSLGIDTDPVSPFALLAMEDAPERHRARSERFAEKFFGAVAPLPPVAAQAKGRLRLGYFSGDFHGHATAFLAARLFELHDRSRFEVHAFSYGPPVGDSMRARLSRAFDSFHDVRAASDESAARRAREMGIGIAIDLKGYTEGQRLGILAYRPAPVQLTFLGYPGTTGAPFVDYLVADRHVVPAAEREHYSEKLIVLPDCYQPTDNQRPIGERGSRRDAGLLDEGFVFASFNHSWKIGRHEFDCWAGLLRETEGSLLWLLASDPVAEHNLRREIEARGVDPERLVFAPLLPQQQHLARLGHADLLLDTFTYGAHTSASDALWAGVPVVTCGGRGFATRVATSILHAAGLPELATASRADYAALALALASDPQRLGDIRTRLDANRGAAPLFDSAGFTRAFEEGLSEAYRRAVAGEPAVDIRLD